MMYQNINDGSRILVDKITAHDTYFYRQNDTHALSVMDTKKFHKEFIPVKSPKIKHESGKVTEMKAKEHPLPMDKYHGGKTDGATNVFTHIYGDLSGGAYKGVDTTVNTTVDAPVKNIAEDLLRGE